MSAGSGPGRGLLSGLLASFAPAPRSPFAVEVLPHTHGVSAGDLDGDGQVVGKHPYQRLRTADVNGDGHVDIVTTNLEGDDATVLLGDGHRSLSPAAVPKREPANGATTEACGDGNVRGLRVGRRQGGRQRG
jgi:hypothetical protein